MHYYYYRLLNGYAMLRAMFFCFTLNFSRMRDSSLSLLCTNEEQNPFSLIKSNSGRLMCSNLLSHCSGNERTVVICWHFIRFVSMKNFDRFQMEQTNLWNFFFIFRLTLGDTLNLALGPININKMAYDVMCIHAHDPGASIDNNVRINVENG